MGGRTKFKNLEKYFVAPHGSEVIMTPNAYMTDGAWLELVPKLCKAIRNQNVIREYPHWWVALSYDGFGSESNSDLIFYSQVTYLLFIN